MNSIVNQISDRRHSRIIILSFTRGVAQRTFSKLHGECVNWNASPGCDSAMKSQALGRLQNRCTSLTYIKQWETPIIF